MNALATLPAWAALLVAVLALASALLTFIGSIGLLRLKRFYSRMHAPTLATTLGVLLMVTAHIVYFSMARERLVIDALLVGVFVTVTTPISLILLTRAALARDRAEGAADVPPAHGETGPEP